MSQKKSTVSRITTLLPWGMSRIGKSHVTHTKESCHTYEEVMSRIWTSHVTHMYEYINESCHTYEWVMSHILLGSFHVVRLRMSDAREKNLLLKRVFWRNRFLTRDFLQKLLLGSPMPRGKGWQRLLSPPPSPSSTFATRFSQTPLPKPLP